MTLGLVVGKFYPPHLGHKHLIETARRHVDHLIVIVAHHASQKIPGHLRQSWLEEIHPDCEIRLVDDVLDDDSQQWADFTLKLLGRAPDIVFTSEDYGEEYASLMGSRHRMVDRNRIAYPISGTRMRQQPLENLRWVEPCVRAWLVPRVVFIGAESTGKTTLAKLTAEHFRTNWVPEYGREHWEKKMSGFSIQVSVPGWTRDEFEHIAREQQRREDMAARHAIPLLICDTNAFATGTWFERYFGTRDPVVDQIGLHCKSNLYLVCQPDIPFVQDGFRDGEKIRGWMHHRFLQLLTQRGEKWRMIEGSFEARFEVARTAMEEILRNVSIE